MKISYHSPEAVQSALDAINLDTAVALEGSRANQSRTSDSRADLSCEGFMEEGSDVELEIDFDPPQPPIRIASHHDIPLSGPRRSYTITSTILSHFVDRLSQQLLKAGKKISMLRLNKVCVIGDEDSLWATATTSLVDLQHVSAKSCIIDVNAWITALQNLPRLKSLTFSHVIWGNVERGQINPAFPVLTTLLQRQRVALVKLSVEHVGSPESNSQVEFFCRTVQSCSTLKHLACSVWSGYTSTQLTFLADLIQANTGLSVLELLVTTSASLLPVAHSLAHNTTLCTLKIDNAQQTLVDDKTLLAEVFAFHEVISNKNVTLQVFHVKHEDYEISRLGGNVHVCLQRWETNPSAVRADTGVVFTSGAFTGNYTNDCGDKAEKACKSIEFFLELNRLGRGRFVKCENDRGDNEDANSRPRAEWMEIVMANRENVSVVFYFIQLNPSMYFV